MHGEVEAPAARGAEPESAHEVFVAWERLRLAYNGLLGIEVIALYALSLADRMALGQLALLAIAANVSFCAGPVAEGYLDLLGTPRRVSRWLLFGLGCCAGVALTLAHLNKKLMADF